MYTLFVHLFALFGLFSPDFINGYVTKLLGIRILHLSVDYYPPFPFFPPKIPKRLKIKYFC